MRCKGNGFTILTGGLLICCLVIMASAVSAQEVEEAMQWEMVTAKSSYYPGEPVLLSIQITNPLAQNGEVWLGSDSLEAFTFAIKDKKGRVLRQGQRIERSGLTRSGFIQIPAQESQAKRVVLNQWCSTLLSSGDYTIVCTVKPYYVPREAPSRDKAPPAAQSLREINLECALKLIDTDVAELGDIIADLASKSFQPVRTSEEVIQRSVAREMLAFTESSLAVPQQLRIIESCQYTWLKRDAIKQLSKSGTPEAAQGLARIFEEAAEGQEDVKENIKEEIYRLRATGDPEIVRRTNGFVLRHPRSE